MRSKRVAMIVTALIVATSLYVMDYRGALRGALSSSSAAHGKPRTKRDPPKTTGFLPGGISAIKLPREPIAAGFGPFCPAAPDEPPTGKLAYILTPADSAYFLATLVTAQSVLDHGTVADIVVAYLETDTTITEPLLQLARDMGLKLRKAPMPPTGGAQASLHKRFDTSGMKIMEPWGLTEYDRVIYLDMDNIVQRNIDHLFYCPDLTAVDHVYQLNEASDPNCDSCRSSCKPQRKWLMSAMMVLRPDVAAIKPMMACTHPDIPWAIADMDFINCHYRCQFHALPLIYQQIDRADLPPFSNDTYVVHWSCGRKPFWVEYRETLISPTVADVSARTPIVAGATPGCHMTEMWHALFWRMGLHKVVAEPGFVFPPLKP
jgi:hypothetical protein